jgi:predicted alpha/beta-hydrolase family hydrolase
LRDKPLRGFPLLVGGRSSGARVACRTSGRTGAIAVLCLAFPLQPPRRTGATPAVSRLDELDAVSVPTLIVQGVRDPFGVPPAGEHRTVALVQGDHSLRSDVPAIRSAVGEWVEEVLN